MAHHDLVYYAIDANPRYVFMARRSVASLRAFNPSVPVRIVVFGALGPVDQECFRALGAEVVTRPEVDRVELFFIKWNALQWVDAKRAIFVDADTAFYQDVTPLFEQVSDRDFAARVENGTRRDDPLNLPTEPGARPHFDHEIFADQAAQLGASVLPVFNTGVMVFGESLREALAANFRLFGDLLDNFREGAPYPCENPHILEEIVASLVLGLFEGLTYRELPRELAPWFDELKCQDVGSPGVVLHTWTSRYEEFLVGTGTTAEIEEWRALDRRPAGPPAGVA